MKQYQHEVSIVQKMQQTATAYKLYKNMKPSDYMSHRKLDFGFFVAGGGQFEEADEETLGSFSAAFGANVVFSYDFTKPFMIGPAPLYFNFHFSCSAGISIDAPRATGDLFAAYANDGAADEGASVVDTEPTRYPNLAPKATKLQEFDSADVKVLNYKENEIVFHVANSSRVMRIRNQDWDLNDSIYYYIAGSIDGVAEDYKACDYDIYNDGKYLHLLATLAKSFDGDGKPVPGGTREDPNLLVCYVEFDGIGYDQSVNPRKHLLRKNCIVYPWVWDNIKANGLSPTCSTPKIESVISNNKGNVEVYGSIYGQSDEVDLSQFNLFYIEPDKKNMVIYGDLTVGINFNIPSEKQYRRMELHSNMRNAARDLDDPESGWRPDQNMVPCLGFTALETPVDGEGKNKLVLFDYYQNLEPAYAYEKGGKMRVGGTRRTPIILAEGDISSYQVLQFMDKDGVRFSQTIFYTQEEEQDDRVVNHLKGFYVSPVRTIGNINHWYYDYTVVDYDIDLPTRDFSVATIGASRYLYWLNTVTKEKESDPDIWRISGVYYDSATNSFSDVMVIAEFTLPDIRYNGKTCKAVPQEITLADNGKGYITAKPNTASTGWITRWTRKAASWCCKTGRSWSPTRARRRPASTPWRWTRLTASRSTSTSTTSTSATACIRITTATTSWTSRCTTTTRTARRSS